MTTNISFRHTTGICLILKQVNSCVGVGWGHAGAKNDPHKLQGGEKVPRKAEEAAALVPNKTPPSEERRETVSTCPNFRSIPGHCTAQRFTGTAVQHFTEDKSGKAVKCVCDSNQINNEICIQIVRKYQCGCSIC